jgi:hypothetical protein
MIARIWRERWYESFVRCTARSATANVLRVQLAVRLAASCGPWSPVVQPFSLLAQPNSGDRAEIWRVVAGRTSAVCRR